MNVYEDLKAELLQINQMVANLLGRINTMPGTSQHSFSGWENICKSIEDQLSDELIRVAVIGTIKSGKSTLINALFSGDYLKRGAGVVTSMVTKVRRGEQLKASLYFKPLDEVNSDIERALVLFPSMEWRSRKEPFDIRQDSDRGDLKQALGSLETKQLLSNDTRNLHSLYLLSYLKGYDRVKAFLGSDQLKQEFTDREFSSHRDFSGNEALAFYLKDISLEIDSGEIEKNIEIADCQGSDSPNPLHMAMIQDYLLLANLLIYVISSRTGIRQADLNFLSMIKKMGIIDHMIFVVNCDFSEHESLKELQALVAKVVDDLAIIKKDPDVYSYSALYSLFGTYPKALSPKDQGRLKQWEDEKEIITFSNSQEVNFKKNLQEVVTRKRYSLLLRNHFERIKMIVSGLNHWICVNQDVLTKGSDEAARLIKKIKSQQKKTDRVKALVRSTLAGALQQIRREIKVEVDHFFDNKAGDVVPVLIDFIKSYHISLYQYEDRLTKDGFSNTLYLVFQEFKHGLDTFMAENINPKIFHFVKNEEEKIIDYFDSISGPYEVMVNDALSEYNAAMERLGLGVAAENQKITTRLDMDTLKRVHHLELPPAAATMNYSTAIKTEAIMRLGFYNFIKGLKRLIRQPVKNETENALSALKDAISRMKKETEGSLVFHFKNYKENLKFQYIFKLLDAASNQIYDAMMERFHDYTQDLSQLTSSTARKQVDKEALSRALQDMAADVDGISERMDRFGDALKQVQ